MTSIRVRVDMKILKKLKERHTNKFFEEYGVKPTESNLVMLGLLESESYINNIEYEIKLKKNGKIVYKIKKI
jgi:hypothetical protein